jgi:molecular chaperone DnaK (HSP70)
MWRKRQRGKLGRAPNSENALTTPSVVYFESGNNIVVGQIAKDTAEVYPDLIVQTVKRHMGDANWLRSFHGRDYRPQDVSALILRKVVGDAEQVLGQTIEDVVITCPAYFGDCRAECPLCRSRTYGRRLRLWGGCLGGPDDYGL